MLKPAALFILFSFALSLHAQERPFAITVQAGATFASIDPDWNAFDPKFRTGFFVGVGMQWPLSEKWSIPVDLRFAQRGFYNITPAAFVLIDGQIGVYKGRVDYRSICVDLIPQVSFRPVKHLSLAAGPYLSWRNGEAVQYGDVVDWTSTSKFDLFSDIDFGLSGRVGGHVGRASVFVSYLFGLTEYFNVQITDENGQGLGTLGAKNRAILVGAGWQF
ncbi:MAG: porin family protein [Saprospiraceae bacterium]